MEAQRGSRAAVLAISAALLAISGVFVALRFAIPSDGAVVDHRALSEAISAGVLVHTVEESPGLREGDRVIAVAGVELARGADIMALALTMPLTEGALRARVVRDGMPDEITVQRGSYSLSRLVTDEWSTLAFTAAMMLIGAYVFRRRPDDEAARAMLVMSAALAGSTASFLAGNEPADLVAGPMPLLAVLGVTAYLLFFAALLWFAVAFAKPSRLGPLWRPLAAMSAAVAVGLPATVLAVGTLTRAPAVASLAQVATLSDLAVLPILLLVPFAFVLGYRSGLGAEHRDRVRWVAIAFGATLLTGLTLGYLPQLLLGAPIIPWSASGVLALPLPITIGVAIVRHRAFDIRVAANRSLVYGSLTLAIVGIYVAVLAGVGGVLREQAGLGASLVATGVVAVVVQPLREVLQRWVNRLMYGDRDDPYTAIARLGRHLSASLTPDEVLPAIAATVARGLRVPFALVEGRRGDALEVSASVGRNPDGHQTLVVPLSHRGEAVGRIVIAGRGDEPFSVADRQLLDDLARQSAAAVQAVVLMAELERARRRLVTVREEERRALRHQLHDEVGPSLAAIGLEMELVRLRLSTSGPAERVAIGAALSALRANVGSLIGEVRRTAHDLGERAAGAAAPQRVSAGDGALAPGTESAVPPEPATVEVAGAVAGASSTRRGGRFAISVGLVLIALAGVVLAVRASRPADGWALTPDAGGWGPRWAFVFSAPIVPGAADLRSGDQLVAIDGRPMSAILAATATGRPPLSAEQETASTLRYSVIRRGVEREVDVVLRQPSAPTVVELLVRQVLGNPGLVLLLAVALFAVARRPDAPGARLLWLTAASAGASLIVETVGGPAPRVADLLDPSLFWPFQALSGAIWPLLVGPAVAHLFLVFPRTAPVLAARPRLLPGLLYGVAPGLFVVLLLITGGDVLRTWMVFGVTSSMWMVALLAVAVARVVLLASRERDREARAQVRWVALGFLIGLGFAVPSGVLWFVGLLDAQTALDASRIYVIALPVTLAIAILHHRLFDIDLVLNRALVATVLTSAVLAIYVGVVALVGLVVAQAFAGSLIATGIVAIMVQPLRARVQRGINRLMYGERDDPYAVVSRLGERLAAIASLDALMPEVAEAIAQALRLPFVEIDVDLPNGRTECAARVGRPQPAVTLPLVSQGAPYGRLRAAPRGRGETLSASDRALLEELARQTARLAQAVRLRRDLDDSHARLSAARAGERRRLQRDLHDGLGPALAALAVSLEVAESLLDQDPLAAGHLLEKLAPEVRAALDDIRRLVLALRPPALDELGLAGAIRQQAARLEVDVGARAAGFAAPEISVLVDAVATLPAAVEVAAYRIALEALTNVVRHARASRAIVRLSGGGSASAPALVVEVEDDGIGFVSIPSDDDRHGLGVESMRERAEELGGNLAISRGELGGTLVRAVLPLDAMVNVAEAA